MHAKKFALMLTQDFSTPHWPCPPPGSQYFKHASVSNRGTQAVPAPAQSLAGAQAVEAQNPVASAAPIKQRGMETAAQSMSLVHASPKTVEVPPLELLDPPLEPLLEPPPEDRLEPPSAQPIKPTATDTPHTIETTYPAVTRLMFAAAPIMPTRFNSGWTQGLA